ncbi:twin-arginine translocation signal domain-containing protein [Thiosocius teredinicola]|uniref:twin-arginine translocation signal domain-containing protein n=1 Tax=Thiosocius teredinicola TaxID=1973002 RepID=UPI0013DDE327
MKESKDKVSQSRREFLRNAGKTGGLAAAAAVAPGAALAGTQDAPTEEPKAKDGYRLTQHILDYYKSAAS